MSSFTPNKGGRYNEAEDGADDHMDAKQTRGGRANSRKPAVAGSDAPSSPMTRATGNERIYEAYNDLHNLAQVVTFADSVSSGYVCQQLSIRTVPGV